LDESGLRIEDFGYSRDYKDLKKAIKYGINGEGDEKLKRLTNVISKLDCESVRILKQFLHYLKDKNYKADINELING
jgi:hypothetical protein